MLFASEILSCWTY